MILVIGASGSVGSVLTERLRAGGQRVRAAYRGAGSVDAALAAGHEAARVDLADPSSLPPALLGVDTVFLLGAMGPTQTEQELGVVAASARAGVRRVVKLSVWRADEELTPIARLHRPVERALEESGLVWTILRPNFYMQNFSRQLAAEIRRCDRFTQPANDAPISFVDTRDVAASAARVLTAGGHDNRTYDLTGPAALRYQDAAEVLSRELGRPVRYVGLPDRQARESMLARGLAASHADALLEVNSAYRDGGAARVSPAVGELTGWEPISFERFVSEHRDRFAAGGVSRS